MSRRLQRWLIIVGVLLVLGGAFLWALPEIVRRQALKQIPQITGRAASIEDIDLNLFTGRLAIKKFRLAEQDPTQTFVEFERLDLRLVLWPLVVGNVRLADFTLTAPTVNLARLSPAEFNFSDIIKRLATSSESAPPKPVEPKAKSRWTVSVNHFALVRANITASDRAVSPTSEWKVRDLTIEAGNLTTRPSGPVGTLAVHGALNGSPIEFSARDIDLTPTSFAGKFSIQNFALPQIRPYLPSSLPAVPEFGILGVTLAVRLELGQGGLAVGLVSGDITVASLAVTQMGKAAPFLTVPRIAVGLKEANLVSRVVTISSVDIEGLDLKAGRDKQEKIDLLELTKPSPGALSPAAPPASGRATPAPPPSAPNDTATAAPAYRVTIERIGLKGVATFTDEAVSPTARLKLTDLTIQVDDLTWPPARPLALALSTGLPGGGTFGAKGPVSLDPIDANLTVTTRDAPIEPYKAYFPFPASFSGRFNADSQNRIRIVTGAVTVLSRGNSWATNLAVQAPDAKESPLRLERLEINGIDFGWPTHARVAKIRLKSPVAEVDRSADGTLNLQALFTPSSALGSPPAAPPTATAAPRPATGGAPAGPATAASAPAAPPTGAAAKPKPGLLETMELYFKEIVVEDGYVRFLDHTTTPPFSEDISKLTVSVKDLSNKPSQRANLLLQAVIGGDSAMDIRGEMSGIGAEPYVDMVGELKKFTLATANPYVDNLLAWLIRRGDLTAKFEYRIEKGQLDAKNDILVGNLRVAPARASDEVKKRIGLPLGLIVALIKDGDGNIHVNVPITGTLTDRKFDFSEAIWTAVKNIIINILKAPFRAIGGLFTSGDKIDEIKVDPVTFAAGSAVLSPGMERQVVHVADFLRRSPYVSLTLSSVTSPADVEALKQRAVAARLENFQKEQGIVDLPSAVRRYYQVFVKDAQLPRTVDDQVALLQKREPMPEGPLGELRQRRLEVTRDRLAKTEGIQEARLHPAPADAAAPPPAAQADTAAGGRVEFGIAGESD